MKFLTVILSFYIVLLACKPCIDGDNLAVLTTESVNKVPNHSHQESDDTCSPFCMCSCCGLLALHDTQLVDYGFITIPNLISNPVLRYEAAFASAYCGSIWQPPQMVGMAV